MGWITDFFKNFKQYYEAQIIRNQKMDEFLLNAKDNHDKIKSIDNSIGSMKQSISAIEKKVDTLSDDVTHINGRLEVIGKGTKMELFDTLYHWKKMLVDERGWASAAEKKEVKQIYEIYHDELGGNGQGEVYYSQIIALPEQNNI